MQSKKGIVYNELHGALASEKEEINSMIALGIVFALLIMMTTGLVYCLLPTTIDKSKFIGRWEAGPPDDPSILTIDKDFSVVLFLPGGAWDFSQRVDYLEQIDPEDPDEDPFWARARKLERFMKSNENKGACEGVFKGVVSDPPNMIRWQEVEGVKIPDEYGEYFNVITIRKIWFKTYLEMRAHICDEDDLFQKVKNVDFETSTQSL